MKKTPVRLFLIGFTLLISLLMAEIIQAQGDSATTVINTINQLRAQNGLAALQSHPSLMQIALQHSQYQASLGTWTHVSADGSRPIDRAYAAGFGNGATILSPRTWPTAKMRRSWRSLMDPGMIQTIITPCTTPAQNILVQV